jgi:peptidoglycan/xylan/chitin deacetylase (PgdA/CDA1 family)
MAIGDAAFGRKVPERSQGFLRGSAPNGSPRGSWSSAANGDPLSSGVRAMQAWTGAAPHARFGSAIVASDGTPVYSLGLGAGMKSTDAPSGWPRDRPLAISVNVMLEGWAAPDAPGMGPMGNLLKPGTPDLQARSWADYGPKVGAWRLLDLLDQEETKAVFYTSGVVADRFPALPAAIAQRGHSVGAHGWSQGTLPAYLTPEQETADIARCVEVIRTTTGSAPSGWLSPRCTPSTRTQNLLLEHGFWFHAEMFDSDLPYLIETGSGCLVGVPFTMEVNDMPLYVRYGNEPDAFTRTLTKIVEGWPRLGSPFGCLDITVHAHVFGRPYGALALLDSLAVVKRNAHCWLTNHRRLAELWRK